MQRCKHERKAKTNLSIRELAKRIGKTENYVSSIENGREIPSLRTFLKYLIACDFDTNALKQLSIDQEGSSSESRARETLINKIYSLDENQVHFLVEQTKVSEIFKVKTKKSKSSLSVKPNIFL